jgi:hypothetical protein
MIWGGPHGFETSINQHESTNCTQRSGRFLQNLGPGRTKRTPLDQSGRGALIASFTAFPTWEIPIKE